ncbi:MAG: NAD(P)/FAD-dependent oxidoreductase [Elainellaceae cyanobacterium]
MPLPQLQRVDVAIIGSGIAGSTLAIILARQGLRVVVFEADNHPKFAIGESMILETSEVMRSLAELYDVPELAYFSSENYFDHIGTSHGVKRHFSYLHHVQGQPFNTQHTLQAVIPEQPHGHELHLYRQDTDYFLATVAVRYGATVLQKTPIQSVEIHPHGVHLSTKTGQIVEADYVVDAGGFHSVLAMQFDLRHHNLQTHSRAIFTHMVDVPCFHQVSDPKQAYGLPFFLSEGTLHHVFEGGWLWVIPFDNHARSTNPLCSVGLMLDPRRYPLQSDLSPETEFYQFIQQFPGIAPQFQSAKAVRPWTRTGRLQYSAQQVVGDRFCLLGQAAGFIDPLFSKGLYTALICTSVLADRLLAARATRDYSAAGFQVVEDITLAFIQANDRLVANAYRSFVHYDLWTSYLVLWLLGAYLELVKLMSSRAFSENRRTLYYSQLQGLKLTGGAFPPFEALAKTIYAQIENADLSDPPTTCAVSQQVHQHLTQFSWMPYTFQQILHGKNHLPANKFNPRLLKPRQGFMGYGIYRTHFFNQRSLSSLIYFFLREKFKYSRHSLQRQRAVQLRDYNLRDHNGLFLSPKWAALATLVLAFSMATYTPHSLKQEVSPEPDSLGLVNFLRDPTAFQITCGVRTGKIIHASLEGNHLTIEVMYFWDDRRVYTTFKGTFDQAGQFQATYEMHLPDTHFSGEMVFQFDQDGSALGIDHDLKHSIKILKV